MTAALVYTFAVERGVEQPAGASPLPVLARQLPRLAVQLLNGDDDRGVRYFPLIGVHDGKRQFLEIDELLDLEVVGQLHRQRVEPTAVVDGCLQGSTAILRILDGDSGRVCFEEQLPFDATAPLALVQRLMFEVMGHLRWPGAPPAAPELDGEALACFMQGRDDLLRLEANLVVHDPAAVVDAASRAVRLAPGARDAWQLVTDLLRRLGALGEGLTECEPSLCSAAHCVATAAPPVSDAGALDALEEWAQALASGGAGASARAVSEIILARWPGHAQAACRVASAKYAAGDLEAAHRALRDARTAGADDGLLLTQLAVVAGERGDEAERAALIDELQRRDDLSAAAVRVVVAHLLDEQRAEEALQLVTRSLERFSDDASLCLDHGRALLSLEREREAAAAFERCLTLDPEPAVRREAERHLALAHVPASLSAAQRIDAAIRAGDLVEALSSARRFVWRASQLAESWLLLGVVRHRMDQPRRAERALRKALEINPDYGEAHNRLGILLVARGRYQDARAHLDNAVRLLPEEPSPRIHLAQACHYLGDTASGLRALSEAEQLGGDHETLAAVRQAFFDGE